MKKNIFLVLSFLILSILTSCDIPFLGNLTLQPPTSEHSHDYESKIVEPTCEEKGYTIYFCECGESYIDDEIVALGHNYNENEWGYKGVDGHAHICTVCNKKDEVLNHVSNGEATETEAETCAECGFVITEVLVHTHTPSEEVISDDTHHWNACVGCATEKFNYAEHDWKVEIISSPTCTENGVQIITCECGMTKREEVAALGHTEVIDAKIEPTCTTTGLSEGKWCSTCKEVLVPQEKLDIIPIHKYKNYVCVYCDKEYDPSFIEKCNSRYGYNFLGTLENGSNLQEFYNEIDILVKDYHINGSNNSNNISVYFGDKITTDEAISVWKTYRDDNPLYYWMSYSVMTINEELVICVVEDYSNDFERLEYTEFIYLKIKEFTIGIDTETSPYMKALYFHDLIIEAIDYAYEDDGVTAQDDHWAHSIVGVFDKGLGVCESYARTYQLLLNYTDVENVFVTGVAGSENHAWNMVKLDDEQWYWFDLTWNDGKLWGISHDYFALDANSNFTESHFCDSPTDIAEKFLYSLPKVSTNSIVNDYQIDKEISIDGWKYKIVGRNSLELIYIPDVYRNKDIVIPEKVTYLNKEFEIISIERVNNCVNIYIPKTVKFIWDFAFNYSIENIYVSEKNETYSDKEGVLFTKNLYTLIQYPMSNKRVEYIIPEETAYVAYGAFRYSNPLKTKLERLIIGKNIMQLGLANWENNYPDYQRPFENIVNGAWAEIYDNLVGEKKITVHPKNKYYYSDEIGIYDIERTYLYLVYRDVKEISLDGISVIGVDALYKCDKIQSIIIPPTVSTIEERAFAGCTSLAEVYNLSSLNIVKGSLDNGFVGFYAKVVYTSIKGESDIIATSDGYNFIFDGENYYLISYSGSDTDLVLPEDINGNKYIINDYAFSENTNITSLVISDGVISIGDYAFCQCKNLVTATIGDFVTEIGDYAFYECGNLEFLTLGKSVSIINLGAFYLCNKLVEIYNLSSLILERGSGDNGYAGFYLQVEHTSLEEESSLIRTNDGYTFIFNGEYRLVSYDGAESDLILPDDINGKNYVINDYAFYENEKITSVVIPDNVLGIGDSVFFNCPNLTSVIIGNSVTYIGASSFSNCVSLTNIVLGNSLTTINANSFSDCISLEKIVIPSSLSMIGLYAFSGCLSLSSIIVSENNCVYDSREGCNAIIETSTNTLLVGCQSTIIPSTIKVIEQSAFSFCHTLTKIMIPDSVTCVNENAFSYCDSLMFNIYKNGKYLGNKQNPYLLFVGVIDKKVKTFEINPNTKIIGSNAFYQCDNLINVILPTTVNKIEKHVFNELMALKKIYYLGEITNWNKIIVEELNALLPTFTIYCYSENKPTSAGDYWHYDIDGITPVVW